MRALTFDIVSRPFASVYEMRRSNTFRFGRQEPGNFNVF